MHFVGELNANLVMKFFDPILKSILKCIESKMLKKC